MYIEHYKPKVTPEALQKGIEVHDAVNRFYDFEGESTDEIYQRVKDEPWFKKHEAILLNFIQLNRNFEKKTGKIVRPVYREIKHHDEGIDFTGVLDRVDFDGEDYAVFDYKTGKTHPIDEYRYELAMYAYLLEKKHRVKAKYWGIIFLEHNKIVMEPANAERIKDALAHTMEINEQIKASDFPKNPNRLCPWCSLFQDGDCAGWKGI
jgi:RecB family exonuclease